MSYSHEGKEKDVVVTGSEDMGGLYSDGDGLTMGMVDRGAPGGVV